MGYNRSEKIILSLNFVNVGNEYILDSAIRMISMCSKLPMCHRAWLDQPLVYGAYWEVHGNSRGTGSIILFWWSIQKQLQTS